MTLYKYVVTAQKPTATQFALRASFTARNETNLILGRNTRVEIYTLVPDGLKPTLEFSINGSIRAMEEYKPRGRDKASIFILTARRKYCILTYSEKSKQIHTEASGEIIPTEAPYRLGELFGCLDPTSQYFAVHLNECTIAIVTSEAFSQRALKEIYVKRGSLKSKELTRRGYHGTVRPQIDLSLGYNRIVNMAFLHGTTQPTLAVLYDNHEGRRLLETFVLNPQDREFEQSSKLIEDLSPEDNDRTLISLPLPLGGIILAGSSAIRYLSPGRKAKAISNKGCAVNCFTMLSEDGTRILMGDCNYGGLFLLTLIVSGRGVDSMSFVKLGTVSIPSSLAYLDNDVIYVGSSFGDCQLVHIQSSSVNKKGDVLEVVEEYPNLAPVHDFCVADLDKQGQSQLITCSGFGNDAAPRIIRHGVGLNELATVDISGVKGIWALRPFFESSYDDILVFSFLNETRILQLRDSEMSQLDSYSAFALNERTLTTRNVLNGGVVQVTDKSVLLMEVGVNGKLLDTWQPSDGSRIIVAAVNASQCVVSLGFGRLIALSFRDGKILEVGTTKLRHDVSCIDITPVNSPRDPESMVVAVGVWKKIGVRLLAWPSLEVLAAENLPGTAVPRSLLMAKFEGISYLLVAMGDGGFYNFKLDDLQGRLWDKKRSFLGKMPIALSIFFSNDTMHVFAASDKPSVIHSRNRKLIYSNVNLKDVRCVTSFNSLSFPDAVALTTKDGLIIGQMEEIQKLHISKIPSIDMPLQIVHQESSRTFGILTNSFATGPTPRPNDITGALVLQDDQSFKVLDRIYVKYLEHFLTLTSAVLDIDGNEYYVLGTGIPNSEFETKATGRLVVMRVTPERKLKVVGQTRTKGMVDCVTPFQGKLVASIGSTLCLYEWTSNAEGTGNLTLVCSQSLPSYCKSLAVHDDIIAAGDLMSSLGTLRYDAQKQVIEQVGRDFERKEITAVAALGGGLFIAAEESGHLFVFQQKPVDEEEEMDEALEIVGQWNFGDRIVRFRFGSLGTSTADYESRPVAPSLIFCSASGSIGVIADLSADLYKLLSQMQNNMNRIIPSIGDLSHSEWRNVSLLTGEDYSMHFIDGDLIESFLDLTPQQMQMVVDGRNGGRRLEKSVEDLCKVVEELMSVHS